MRILIIGGTGFIGPHVVRWLVEQDAEVTVFHRGQTRAEPAPEVAEIPQWLARSGKTGKLPLGVGEILGSRECLADFTAFKKLEPDVVLDMFPMNETDARAVMGTFEGLAGRVVAVSSSDVYRAFNRLRRIEPGPPDPVPLSEDAPLREKLYPYRHTAQGPGDPLYEYEKILVERVVLGNPDLPGTVLRLPAVYGPGDPLHRTFAYLKQMADGRHAILLQEGEAQWRFCRGYVEDVALAIALAVLNSRAAGRVYNVAEPEALTQAEWVRAIGEGVGWQGRVVVLSRDRLPQHLVKGDDFKQHLAVDSGRIRAELGYREAVTREEALRRTVAWERAHPPVEIDPAKFDYVAEDAAIAGWAEGR